MTNREFEILGHLAGTGAARSRPMDFGGSNASQHSKVAVRMIAKGWVERERRGRLSNPFAVLAKLSLANRSYAYRITEKGRLARNNAAELRALADRI